MIMFNVLSRRVNVDMPMVVRHWLIPPQSEKLFFFQSLAFCFLFFDWSFLYPIW
jgi:hypothetical protein